MKKKKTDFSSRIERKKGMRRAKIGKILTNKWVHGSFVGVAVLTFVVSAVLLVWKTSQSSDPASKDYSTFFSDLTYSITIDDEGKDVIGFVTSEDMAVEDAVQLSNVIRTDLEKEVRLYVYETEEERTQAPDFYEEGLRYSVQTYPDSRYESRLFHNMPRVEADVESVSRWNINERESYVDTNNVLHVSGEVPTMATTEETVAFLKGLDGVVSDLNDGKYDNTLYSVKQGLNKLLFSANHPQVIADVELYQMGSAN